MKTFCDLELISPILQAVVDTGYTVPTPIQAQTIPGALQGQDILACARTGTGKTAAFALPILNRLGQENRKSLSGRPFALVLAPTRELAQQIGGSFASYGRHLNLRQTVIHGGVSQRQQTRSLARGVHILTATPGRLIDLMEQGHVDLSRIEVFVLDEADRMLDMGFLPALKQILRKLPADRQSLFFSATLPKEIVEFSRQLLRNPVSVRVEPEPESLPQIEQQVRFVDRAAKPALLCEILRGSEVDRALVFTRTKRGATQLSRQLERSGVTAAVVHGNKSQNARQRALEAFRHREVHVLVATDVASRGLDIAGVSHVINFDLPVDSDTYVHRIGRTGRAGASGIAVSFCTPAERADWRAIERSVGGQSPDDTGNGSPQTDPVRAAAVSRSAGRPKRGPQRSRSSGPSAGQDRSTTATAKKRTRRFRRRRSDGKGAVPSAKSR